MPNHLLTRRTMLRGLGVTMALPWLESTPVWGDDLAGAGSGGPPVRFACLFGGDGFHASHWWAKGSGSNLELSKVLEPLVPHKQKLNFIRGLFNEEALKGSIHSAQTGNLLSGAPLASHGEIRSGTSIDQVVLQDVNPPDPVRPSWDDVSQAQQQAQRQINEAEAEYNAVIPRASGEAEQTVLQAEGYALDRVNRAEGEAARFAAVEAAYRQAPEVTRQRMYLETMQQILPQVGHKVFVAEGTTGVLPLLSLDRGARAATAALTNTTQQTGGGQ